VLVPLAWQGRTWSDTGSLSYGDHPVLPDDARLVPGGPTASDVAKQEHDEYGDCSSATTYFVIGGLVEDEWYYAVYDVVDGSVCDAGLYRARDGEDLFGDTASGSELVRVAKVGGVWGEIGTVKSPQDLWTGFAAVWTAALQGFAYYGRPRPPFSWRSRGWRERLRQAQVLGWVVSVAAWVFVTVDVVTLPDSLGGLVVGLVGLQLAWSLLGGRFVLAPATFGSPQPPRPPALTNAERRAAVGRAVRARAQRWVRMVRVPRWRRREQPEQAQASSGAGSGAASSGSAFRVIHTGELPHYADVGGLDGVKRFLDDTLGLLLAFADEAGDYRITFNGILFHGPPGVGKTFLAKAVAGEYGLSFIHVSAADLTTGIVGGGARRVVEAFDTAAANVPCVLFFDEFDALAQERASEPDMENRRTVAQLLTSLEEHRPLADLVVMAATNDLVSLDQAVLRPGRFDRHIRVDLPDATTREAVVRACLDGRPVTEPLDLTELVRRTEGRTSSLLASVVETASLAAFRQATLRPEPVLITSQHLLDALESLGGRDRPTVENWSWDSLVLPRVVLEELKQLQRLLEDPTVAVAYGVDPPSGLLLAGPPGTGKTTVARVLAAEAGCSFYPVSAADVTSKWVGESEEAVRALFRRARDNSPAIIFLDEVDAIAGARGRMAEHGDRLLDQLLLEIDGLQSRGSVFVLAATNRPDMLDPALLRGGRLSRTLWLELPDAEMRLELFKVHTRLMPLLNVRLKELADETAGMSGADIAALCQQAALVAMVNEVGGRAAVRMRDFTQARAAMAPANQRNGGL
jgi:SpoVK/Ycf46/Vps4 family AAA+-type ATPase